MKLITYTTPHPSKRRQLLRKLYGFIDYSKKGRYKYVRPGLLSKLEHVKVNKATIMTGEAQAGEIIALLTSLGIKHKVFTE
jgi:hypothetical protein